jgi:DNA-binding LacI/PurR family transcriptional regulator
MPTPTLLGRPPERSSHIVRELRGRITRGDLAPGVQMPTRIEIGQHFNASPDTVQRALQELRRDGYITVKGRRGTYVSPLPPHLKNYGLVFPFHQDQKRRFFSALSQQAPLVAQAAGRQISVYYGVNYQTEHEDYGRLVADVKAHRLGGLIFSSVPSEVVGTPLLDEPNIPRVAIMSPTTDYVMPRICTSGESFWARAADELLGQGRKNLALLLPPLQDAEITKIRRGLEERGFFVPRKWIQVVTQHCPEAGRNLMELLFDGQRQRPDSLIISDDNLVEPALGGVIAAGARVPDEVEIITHCNFPQPVSSVLPVRRLGFDVRRVLQVCFDTLDGLKAGQNVPSLSQIPAQFEGEITEQPTDR